jgi:WD40 repeat protein
LRADQEITIFHKPSIVLGANTVDFTKSGRVMFVGYDDSTIRVWDVLKESQLAVWLGHTDRVAHVQVSPDGTALASASWDKYLKVWA